MDRLNELIAENLKDIRKGKGLSLEQVSSLTTISKSMLSQLERGEVNPTISTVYKLALGLKVPVTAFTAEYVLKAGDAASYNAFDDYVYKNTGKGMVTANIVVHYSN